MAQRDAAGVSWGQPQTDSWRPASAGDAEWMSGKSRTLSCPGLDRSPLMDVGPKQASLTTPEHAVRGVETLHGTAPSSSALASPRPGGENRGGWVTSPETGTDV